MLSPPLDHLTRFTCASLSCSASHLLCSILSPSFFVGFTHTHALTHTYILMHIHAVLHVTIKYLFNFLSVTLRVDQFIASWQQLASDGRFPVSLPPQLPRWHRRPLAVGIAAVTAISGSSDDDAAAAASSQKLDSRKAFWKEPNGTDQSHGHVLPSGSSSSGTASTGGTQAAGTQLINSSLLWFWWF